MFWLLFSFQKNSKLNQRLQNEFHSLTESEKYASELADEEEAMAREKGLRSESSKALAAYEENERRLNAIAVTFGKLQREVVESVRLVLEVYLPIYHVLRERTESSKLVSRYSILNLFASESLYASVGFLHACLGIFVESSALVTST